MKSARIVFSVVLRFQLGEENIIVVGSPTGGDEFVDFRAEK
jgi:hypothetical protein